LVHVLIADDEASIRLLYRSAFELEGAEVDVALDGEDAVEQASTSHHDLIILDLRMPRLDGLSALAQLRVRSPSSRVLLVSAEATVDAFSRARDLGVEECIDKIDFLRRIPSLVSGSAA
jgi:two-component system response regulator AtoC